MKNNTYLPILADSTISTFYSYIDTLDIPQIDYFAIGIQNTVTKTSISLMSLSEWQKTFVTNQYAKADPVRRATLLTKRNFIPFSEIDYVDNFGKEIMRQRSNFGIKNGIILMQRLPQHNYMITLGTGYTQFDAYDFINRYHDKLDLLKFDLINIVKKDALHFLPEKKSADRIIHPSNDAK